MELLRVVACSYRIEPTLMYLKLNKIFKKLNFDTKGIILSSKVTEVIKLSNNWDLYPTDNIDFDFSAYFKGADLFNADKLSSGSILFVNDTIFTDHAAKANLTALLRQIRLLQEIQLPAIAGKLDKYRTICMRNPWSDIDSYISTYCFALNIKALPELFNLIEYAKSDNISNKYLINDEEWGDKLPIKFKEMIRASLIYKKSPISWHRLKNNNFSNKELSCKARAIYYEHRLSGSIASKGCMLPINAGNRLNLYIIFWENAFKIYRKIRFFLKLRKNIK